MTTYAFTPTSIWDLSQDIHAHFNDTLRQGTKAITIRSLALRDGYSLRITTGSHLYPSIELALLHDNCDTDCTYTNFDRFADAFIQFLDAVEHSTSAPIPRLWAYYITKG